MILASASEVRARILRAAGVTFDIVPARVDEDALKQSMLAAKAQPPAIADALAELKALRLSASNPGELVLGADQVLVLNGELISKCATLAEAGALLKRMRGKTHRLISALVLAKDGAPIWRHVDSAYLSVRAFSDGFLENYIASEGESLLSGVGCYKLEGRGIELFDKIDGDYFTILGLPLLPLLSALREQAVIPA
ncbi:MAG TPA: Maf family protein [Rhizomicrobium sp.]|jgi:septum formation protein|nr:Maf family protein [Rhizomicrobium sp.]